MSIDQQPPGLSRSRGGSDPRTIRLIALVVMVVAVSVAVVRTRSARSTGYKVDPTLVGLRMDSMRLHRVGSRRPEDLDFTSRPRLMFLFIPDCPWCHLARPQWEAIASKLGPASAAYGVDLAPEGKGDTVPFFHSAQIVEWRGDAGTLARIKGTAVPLTLVVSQGGVIQYAKVGVPNGDALAELSREFPLLFQ